MRAFSYEKPTDAAALLGDENLAELRSWISANPTLTLGEVMSELRDRLSVTERPAGQ